LIAPQETRILRGPERRPEAKEGAAMAKSKRRLGALAVEKGWLTQDQLLMAMNIQVIEDIERGDHRHLGKILCELGIISKAQIDELLDLMKTWRAENAV
jgi:hypothetical protein